MTTDHDPVSFLERRPGPAFEKRVVSVAPGGSRAYDEADWRDALVMVERGEIELQSTAGHRRNFRAGDVLWLAKLPLRSLRNSGREKAVLVAVSRRRAPTD